MFSNAVHYSAPAPGGGVLHLIGRLAAELAAAAERRRTFRQLRGLDAATLRDIGMSRAEIISVVYGGHRARRRAND